MGKRGVTPLMQIGKKTARAKYFFVREAIGEFFGTLILCFMCVGSSAQYMMKTKLEGGETGYESQVVPVFGIIFGILIAIVTTGGVSGAHINSAVSISLAVAGELSWLSLPGYLIGQLSGAVVGSLLAWSLAHPMLRYRYMPNGTNTSLSLPEFDEEHDLQIAGIFSPLRKGFTVANGISTEFVLTCMLMMAICGAIDKKSSFKPPKYLLSIIFPLIIAGFCFCHDLPSGTLLNPARDLGPRIAAWMLGWNAEYVFKSYDWEGNQQHWWLVGIFGPITGGILGSLIYSFLIGPQLNLEHLNEKEEDERPKKAPYTIPDDGQDTSEAKIKGVATDWRSTRFVPKPQGNPSMPPGYNYNNNNNNYQQHGNHPNGYANQGYHQDKGY